MIRPTLSDDTTALIALAEATNLFEPDQLEQLKTMLSEYFDGSDCDCIWITDDDNGPVGVAYCEPEPMTRGTWNLQLIAIHPERQGQGRGKALLSYVEHALASRGARLLLVETMASLERTRGFYRQCGFDEEARIRDFYTAGDDKIVFRKLLSVSQ